MPTSAPRSGPGTKRQQGKRTFRIRLFFLFSFIALILGGYFALVLRVFQQHAMISKASSNSAAPPIILTPKKDQFPNNTTGRASTPLFLTTTKRARYPDWKLLAVQLAALPADQILATLQTQDPFGVRQFEENLKQTESDRQAILQMDDIKALFPCPTDQRITLPDQRDHKRSQKYRHGLHELNPKTGEDFSFLFFQHLRKAGGTNFCSLAQHNLLKPQVPS